MLFYLERNSESTARPALLFHSLGSFLKEQVELNLERMEDQEFQLMIFLFILQVKLGLVRAHLCRSYSGWAIVL